MKTEENFKWIWASANVQTRKMFFHFLSMKFHAFYDFCANQIHLKLCHSTRFIIPLIVMVTPSMLCFPCLLNISIPLISCPCLLRLPVVLSHVSPCSFYGLQDIFLDFLTVSLLSHFKFCGLSLFHYFFIFFIILFLI